MFATRRYTYTHNFNLPLHKSFKKIIPQMLKKKKKNKTKNKNKNKDKNKKTKKEKHHVTFTSISEAFEIAEEDRH